MPPGGKAPNTVSCVATSTFGTYFTFPLHLTASFLLGGKALVITTFGQSQNTFLRRYKQFSVYAKLDFIVVSAAMSPSQRDLVIWCTVQPQPGDPDSFSFFACHVINLETMRPNTPRIDVYDHSQGKCAPAYALTPTITSLGSEYMFVGMGCGFIAVYSIATALALTLDLTLALALYLALAHDLAPALALALALTLDLTLDLALDLALAHDLAPALALALALTLDLTLDLALDLALAHDLAPALALALALTLDLAPALALALARTLAFSLAHDLAPAIALVLALARALSLAPAPALALALALDLDLALALNFTLALAPALSLALVLALALALALTLTLTHIRTVAKNCGKVILAAVQSESMSVYMYEINDQLCALDAIQRRGVPVVPRKRTPAEELQPVEVASPSEGPSRPMPPPGEGDPRAGLPPKPTLKKAGGTSVLKRVGLPEPGEDPDGEPRKPKPRVSIREEDMRMGAVKAFPSRGPASMKPDVPSGKPVAEKSDKGFLARSSSATNVTGTKDPVPPSTQRRGRGSQGQLGDGGMDSSGSAGIASPRANRAVSKRSSKSSEPTDPEQ
eukprot:gene16711-22979_t